MKKYLTDPKAVRIAFAHLFFAALFAVAALYIHGYSPWRGNWHSTSMALQAASQDPILSQDFSVRCHEAYHPFFYRAMVILSRPFGIEKTFFYAHFLTHMGFYFAFLFLCRILFKNTGVFALALALLLLWPNRGLELNTLWLRDIFGATLLTHLLILFEIGFLFSGRYLAAALTAGLGLYAHDQLAFISFLASALFMLMSHPSRNFKKIAVSWGVFAVFFIPVLIQLWPFLRPDAGAGVSFIDYTDFRAAHHNRFFQDKFYYVISLLAAMTAAYVYSKARKTNAAVTQGFPMTLKLCGIFFAFALIHYADFYFFKTGYLTKLRLLRLSLFIHVFAVLYLAWGLTALFSHPKIQIRLTGVAALAYFYLLLAGLPPDKQVTQTFMGLLGLSCLLIVYRNRLPSFLSLLPLFLPVFFLLPAKALHWRSYYKKETGLRIAWKGFYPEDPYLYAYPLLQPAWRQLCFWIRDHTEKEALFITPPYFQNFLADAERKTVGLFWGSPGYDDRLKAEWYARLTDLVGGVDLRKRCAGTQCIPLIAKLYAQLPASHVEGLAKKYGARYFATFDRRDDYPFRKIHQAGSYVLYDLEAGAPASSGT